MTNRNDVLAQVEARARGHLPGEVKVSIFGGVRTMVCQRDGCLAAAVLNPVRTDGWGGRLLDKECARRNA